MRSFIPVILVFLGFLVFETASLAQVTMEEFVSCHEGEIVSGVIFKPERWDAPVQGECGLRFDNRTHHDCGVGLCEYVDQLKTKAGISSVHVVHHIVSDEIPGPGPLVGLFNRNYKVKGNLTKELAELNERFMELNSKQMQNKSLRQVDFTKRDNYFELINDSANSLNQSLGILSTEPASTEIQELRMLAIAWRAKYKESVVSAVESYFHDHCGYHRGGTHTIEVTVEMVDELCRDRSRYCNCIVEAHRVIESAKWAQDVLYAQTDNGGAVIRHQYEPNIRVRQHFDLAVAQIANQIGVEHRSASRLAWQGGNSLVNSAFIFLGKDELTKNYLSNTDIQVQDSILNQLDQTINHENVTELAVNNAIGSITNRKVIWVGTNELHRQFRNLVTEHEDDGSNQPIYHIDVFFSILKWDYDDVLQRKKLYYLLGVPKPEHIDWETHNGSSLSEEARNAFISRTDSLKNWIRQTADEVDRQLDGFGVTGSRIEIPLPLTFDRNDFRIRKYWAFCNGLVDVRGSKVHYYMPEYRCAPNYIDPIFKETVTLISEHAKVVPVLGSYGEEDALHCSFLVTKRK